MAVAKERIDDLRFLGGIYQEMENQYGDADYTEPLDGFLGELEQAHEDYFSTGSGPSGEAWPALKPSTVAAKGHGIILVDTHDLEQSLGSGGGGDAIRRTTHRGLIFGTGVPYSIFHQEPDAGALPRREHVGMDDELTQIAVDAVADHTVESLKLKI